MLIRIDDLDKPRNRPGAIEQIIRDLEWLGLDWDRPPGQGTGLDYYLQSERIDLYESAFQALLKQLRHEYVSFSEESHICEAPLADKLIDPGNTNPQEHLCGVIIDSRAKPYQQLFERRSAVYYDLRNHC